LKAQKGITTSGMLHITFFMTPPSYNALRRLEVGLAGFYERGKRIFLNGSKAENFVKHIFEFPPVSSFEYKSKVKHQPGAEKFGFLKIYLSSVLSKLTNNFKDSL
jgi:hypothetical protein